MKIITVSAPGKLMLFGEHAVVYGYPCIVTAVDQRLTLTATITNDQMLTINARDVKIADYKRPIDKLGRTAIPRGAQFVEIAVRNFRQKYHLKSGVSITTSSAFKSTFGFGSSSASTVCVMKALSELLDKNLTNKELFDISYKTVLDIQKKGSGFDVASAIFGGTIYFLTGGKTISSLAPIQSGLAISNLPLIVGYSGVKADTVSLINKVTELSQEDPKFVEKVYKDIAKLVEHAKTALEKSDWEGVGKYMNENQVLLRKLGVSTEKLDFMINAANTAGAYGAKLSGAGGGDCIIVIGPGGKRKAIEKAIVGVGGEIMNVVPNAEGVRVE